MFSLTVSALNTQVMHLGTFRSSKSSPGHSATWRYLALPGTEEHTDGSAESHAIHRFLHWLLILKAPSIAALQPSFPSI